MFNRESYLFICIFVAVLLFLSCYMLFVLMATELSCYLALCGIFLVI